MTKIASDTEKYSAPALSKGLDILELLATQPNGLKKTEIALALNRSVNELYRMLFVLAARGYVLLDEESERYSLSMRLFELSHRFPPTRRLTAVAGSIMEKTAQTLNQSLHLAIPYGSHILVIAQVDSPGNNITVVRLGAQVPMVLTSSGASLLYRLSVSERRDICADNEFFTPEAMKVFEDAVEQVAATGVCESPSSVVQGVLNLSVPIIGYGGEVVAALTIPHVRRLHASDDPDVDTCKRILVAAGKQISEKIGAGAAEGDASARSERQAS
ncbi:IclR family transcriptional regulator [Roseobacter sinensis]|uniref:IclR family transcriptional regulator n=1 Tax=Roseobacter sinensis TaxID=2931391 RepID=A0ABT3B8T5_9RHOB|nr:IclR family transcriptional regulator [Roseobacter sp. WL0113]MCV3269844.1 IclR family transcriptional regulator [Roseobacter sp. WL0113]